MKLPRCIFGRGTPYQCRRAGIGRPPLCREHTDLMDDLDDEEPVGEDFLAQAFRAVLDHPGVRSILEDAASVLRDARSARQPAPADAHYAECPPRPRSRPAKPAPPQTGVLDDPRVVLGFPPHAQLTETMIKKRKRELAAIYHPDHGGSEEAMKRLNSAVSVLLAQLG